MGLIDLPSSRDFIESVDWVVPSDKRNFSRSTPDWAVTFPRDSAFAKDKTEEKDDFIQKFSAFVKNVQQLMRSNPIGSGAYTGPIDGKINPALISSLQKFQIMLAIKTGKQTNIVYGGDYINQGELIRAVKILREHLGLDKKKTTKPGAPKQVSAQLIKSFQSFFSTSQPVIGKLYGGPADGKINPQLVIAAKQAENTIASAIGNNAVKGMLWSDKSKTFNTSTDDLKSALQLIAKHKGKK